MALRDNQYYYKITNISYMETDINGTDQYHIRCMLEFYNERGGELQEKTEQLYVVDKDDFDIDGNIVSQVYKISKQYNMYDTEDIFEEGDING